MPGSWPYSQCDSALVSLSMRVEKIIVIAIFHSGEKNREYAQYFRIIGRMPTFGNFQQAFSTRSVRLFQRLFIMRSTHIFASRKNIFTSPSLAFSAKLIQLFSSSGGRGIGPSGRAGGNRGWMINANLSFLLLAFPTTPNKQERISNAPPPSPFLRRHPFCFFHVRGGRI